MVKTRHIVDEKLGLIMLSCKLVESTIGYITVYIGAYAVFG